MSEKNESRDWELTCFHCNGSGHIFVERQVAERKSDVQEFKEECECCEGRGFTIAFEDIPGIAEYVRKSRPAPSAPGDAQDAIKLVHLAVAEDGGVRFMTGRKLPVGIESCELYAMPDYGRAPAELFRAPAAGDALDKARLDWLEQHNGRFFNKDRISSIVGTGFLVAGDEQGVRHQTVRAAVDAAMAALAAQVPHQENGDA